MTDRSAGSYRDPQAFRMALEDRLLLRSREAGIDLERLRRRVIFERIVSRLHVADPGQWVLKGGMALEVRLRDEARVTKDVDFGLRADGISEEQLRERLIDAVGGARAEDWFALAVGPAKQLAEDQGGQPTWRMKIRAELAGKPFGSMQLDVSPRTRELDATEFLPLPNTLSFAGITTPSVEVIDVHRHAAEKFHAMCRDFGDRDNTRVRDLVDLVILIEHELLESPLLANSVRSVWQERDAMRPQASLPSMPRSWEDSYERLAVEHALATTSLVAAEAKAAALWSQMLDIEGA